MGDAKRRVDARARAEAARLLLRQRQRDRRALWRSDVKRTLYALRLRLVKFWRRLRRRCELCGVNPPAVPVALDAHSQGPFCRECNKGLLFARLYGRSAPRALDNMFRGRPRIPR